ncbi:hypothetical protein ACJX0J_009550, partial [Zea mays]
MGIVVDTSSDTILIPIFSSMGCLSLNFYFILATKNYHTINNMESKGIQNLLIQLIMIGHQLSTGILQTFLFEILLEEQNLSMLQLVSHALVLEVQYPMYHSQKQATNRFVFLDIFTITVSRASTILAFTQLLNLNLCTLYVGVREKRIYICGVVFYCFPSTHLMPSTKKKS